MTSFSAAALKAWLTPAPPGVTATVLEIELLPTTHTTSGT